MYSRFRAARSEFWKKGLNKRPLRDALKTIKKTYVDKNYSVTNPKPDVRSPARTGRFGGAGKQSRGFYATRKRVVMSGRLPKRNTKLGSMLCRYSVNITPGQVVRTVSVTNVGRCI